MEGQDKTIVHEAETKAVIDEAIEAGVGHDNAAITNASVAHSFNATYNHTEPEAACNALGTKLNAILAALRTNGIIL